MVQKAKIFYIDDEKWKLFRKWCVNHDTTIKKELDDFITKRIGAGDGVQQ